MTDWDRCRAFLDTDRKEQLASIIDATSVTGAVAATYGMGLALSSPEQNTQIGGYLLGSSGALAAYTGMHAASQLRKNSELQYDADA